MPPGTNPLTRRIDGVGGGRIQAFRVTVDAFYIDQSWIAFPINAKTLPELIQALAWTNDAVQTLREYGAVEPGEDRR